MKTNISFHHSWIADLFDTHAGRVVASIEMDRKKVFNDLVEFYGKLFPQKENKQKIVAEEWKELRDIKDPAAFRSAVDAKKKEWKQLNLTQGRENIAKFFTFPKTKATTTKAASAPTETSANITEVDLTSTTELEVSSEVAACLSVPEVLYDYFLFEIICFVKKSDKLYCELYTFLKNQLKVIFNK